MPSADGPPDVVARAPRRAHFIRAALVGLCAGLLAVAFRRTLALAEAGREHMLDILHGHPTWGWAVLPAIGLCAGGLVGWMTTRFAPEAAGSGIPHLKGVLLHVRTLNWRRLIPVKFLGGVLGIGSGLSMGREGPTVQMGAAIARAISGPLGTPEGDLPQLFSAGAGAGLAAAFNAPLAGLLFVVEELHRDLSSRTAAGALIAAVCATVITQWLAGNTPSFEAHGLAAMPLAALPLALVVGVLGGAGGVLFNKSLLMGQRMAQRLQRIPHWTLPGIAGLAAGLLGWWMPDALGGGHAVAERLLGGTMSAGLMALAVLFAAKFLLTAVSYSSGAPGGIFAPMLLLGAILGTMLAKTASLIVPAHAAQMQVLAVLGMAAFFVGSVRAPLTGIVLVSEMTGGYDLLFPICISCLAAYLVAEALRDLPIYEALLEVDLERSGHGQSRAEPRNMYIGVQLDSAVAGKRVAQAGLPRGCLIIAIERGGATVLPTAQTVLLAGDHLSILTPGEQPETPLKIVKLCTGL
ncbi:MAG: H(+)/Cl(-) exchange transporter ClcA [Tepidisphaeraceae bacterium]